MPDYAALARQYGALSSEPAQPAGGVDYEALAKQFGGQSEAPEPPKGVRVDGDTFGDKIANAAKAIGAWLPAAGGAIGGVVGGVPGAAVGGAAGEGYRQLAEHATEIPGAIADVARNLIAHPVETSKGMDTGAAKGGLAAGVEAATQAVGQKVGEALATGATGMGKWLMNRATSRVSEKLLRDFPGLSDTLIDNALTVSKGGYGRAYSMLMTAKGKANAALKAADEAGHMIPIEWTPDLADSFKTALIEKAVKSGGVSNPESGEALTTAVKRLDPHSRRLIDLVSQAAENGDVGHLKPSHADLLKTQLQKESRALYANRTAPNGPAATSQAATERAEFASRLNDAIGNIADGYRAANAEAQPLIGAVRGIKQATRANGSVYQAMVRPSIGAVTGGLAGQHEGGAPGAATGAALGMLATSPVGMSYEALLATHPGFQALLKQLPRGAASWLESLVSSQQGQQ